MNKVAQSVPMMPVVAGPTGPGQLWAMLSPRARGPEPWGSRFGACYRQLQALPRRGRRALKRRWRRALAEVALLVALSQGQAWAATINVTLNETDIAAN